ncbi:hypothetical protein RhiirA1_440618 [Rhizophagus irregularis]|uniref:Uncharacterized protein n=1 Tax=Rhizophagus irregularis TaxID=588596 RepID=A0A2N0RYQ1_9GLOM|nr:hypothetical protein RhiirA1_440618 [Rhizophagus irregularis]
MIHKGTKCLERLLKGCKNAMREDEVCIREEDDPDCSLERRDCCGGSGCDDTSAHPKPIKVVCDGEESWIRPLKELYGFALIFFQVSRKAPSMVTTWSKKIIRLFLRDNMSFRDKRRMCCVMGVVPPVICVATCGSKFRVIIHLEKFSHLVQMSFHELNNLPSNKISVRDVVVKR